MYIWIGAVEITERLLQTTMAGLENEPCVTGRIELLPRDRHAKLKGHVEARSLRRVPINLDSRQIMDRIAAALNQSQDSIQSTLAPGDTQSGTGIKTELGQADDVSQVFTTKARVVGNI